MFLNLHSKTTKRPGLDSRFGRQTYLMHNSLSTLNKQKSYSTASLKEEFRKFKNKSLSHALNSNGSVSQVKGGYQAASHLEVREGRAMGNGQSFMRGGYGNGLKINEFKKSYLNLDTKLSKCARPKDYFKPISESQSIYPAPASYIEVQKRLQQQNLRKQLAQRDQLTLLREQTQILKRQNQELRRQRSVDVELIARQNEIMQKQEELIEASQEAINAKALSMQHERAAFTFSNSVNYRAGSRECEDCLRKENAKEADSEINEMRGFKLEEENKILKCEIRQLVYQCQKYKDMLRKADDKYQRELEQNQKLIALIYETDKQRVYQQSTSYKKPISKQIGPHYNNQANAIFESKPISLKRQKGKIYTGESGPEFKSHINSPHKTLAEKSSSTKSAINLLKYSNQTSEQQWEQGPNQQAGMIKRPREQISKDQQHEQKIEWCQNQNIRKYLSQIHQQKAKQIDQIDYLLSRQ